MPFTVTRVFKYAALRITFSLPGCLLVYRFNCRYTLCHIYIFALDYVGALWVINALNFISIVPLAPLLALM